MGGWLATHGELLLMAIGGGASVAALMWRMGSSTQAIIARVDAIAHRLDTAERDLEVATGSRGKLHGRIDELATRMVRVETKQSLAPGLAADRAARRA